MFPGAKRRLRPNHKAVFATSRSATKCAAPTLSATGESRRWPRYRFAWRLRSPYDFPAELEHDSS